VTQAPQPSQEISFEQMSGGALARMRPDWGIGAALRGEATAWPAVDRPATSPEAAAVRAAAARIGLVSARSVARTAAGMAW
jgi:hypothetical protein